MVVGTTDGVPVQRAISDVNGRYVVTGLAAGKYRLAAARAGYLPALLDGVLSLAPEETRRDVNIAMDLPATVSGHVLDSEGDPVEHVQVAAFLSAGETLRMRGRAKPTIAANTGLRGCQEASMFCIPCRRVRMRRRFILRPRSSMRASPLNLARGSEARDIEIRVHQAPLGEVSGVVHGPAKQLVTVTIARKSKDWVMAALPEATREVLTEGRFAFPGLDPGTHVVTVKGSPFSASKEVHVNGGPVEIELTLARR